MMLQTGNKASIKSPVRGFSLLEVMIAAAVLALGATLIYQSFFTAVDSFNYYSALLKITPWMDEQIWQAQNELSRPGSGANLPSGGRLEINNKVVDWSLTYHALDQSMNLYQIDLALFWPQGARQVKLSRSAYAIHTQE